ncbi:MAG: DUF167 domain-containing protein [Pirellulales bacterium]
MTTGKGYAVALSEHAEGVVLAVHAQPGARANAIRGLHDGAVKVAVTTIAEKGKANRALVSLLSRCLGVPKARVVLVSGETNARKRFLIQGLAVADALARLSAVE